MTSRIRLNEAQIFHALEQCEYLAIFHIYVEAQCVQVRLRVKEINLS